MKVHYSINWCGPINAQWLRENGDHWAGGRIDCSPTEDDPWGAEIGLPIMHQSDWNKLSEWLRTLETDSVWTLEQIVEEYERGNPTITWWRQPITQRTE